MNSTVAILGIVPLFFFGTLAAIGGDHRHATANERITTNVEGHAANPAESDPTGLAAADWSSIRAAYEAGRHKVFAFEKGWNARNPGQGFSTTFDERGFTTKPDAGGWNWGLDLQSYGWGATNSVTTPRATTTDGGRLLRMWDTCLTEWYVNDTRGLEHGFTVATRPNSARAPLTVDLAIRGGLQPVVSQDGRNITFTFAQGGTALNYNGLTVLDASGKTVSAKWYPLGSGRLRLQIDDATADYPLTIDPVVQQAYIKASNSNPNDSFGSSVAAFGDTVVVGAPREDSNATGVDGNQIDNTMSNSSAAYIFVRNGSTWVQQAYLKASNTDAGDEFGHSVAIFGDTVIVGAPKEDSGASGVNGDETSNILPDSGATYVFTRTGGVWGQQAYLKASNPSIQDSFGFSVAISGDTLVVGATLEDSSATGINGDQMDAFGSNSGAVYVFVRTVMNWNQQAYIKASNTGSNDTFGSSVAISGDTVVVGARFEDSNATGVNGNQFNEFAFQAGAAYVFVRTAHVWSQQAYLKASNTDSSDEFGNVAISGDTVVIGAPGERSNTTGVGGNQTDNSAENAGAAYVFTRSGTVWSQQAYLKSSNSESGDRFGTSVSISDNTIVIGAPNEDSSATGVNGNQANNSVSGSGAAYVFTQTGAIWTQQTYLKASNTETFDTFGSSVAISGDIVIVGANSEGSIATGVNGNQIDNSAPFSGAVYVIDLDNNPGTSIYGMGSPGCAGTHTLDVTHAPMIGSPNFAISCDNAPVSALGLGIITNAQDSLGSYPGGLGVLVHVDLSVSTETVPIDFSSNNTGNAVAPAAIPNAPAIIGNTYYAMAIWQWAPPACSLSPLNLSTSRGLAITILAP